MIAEFENLYRIDELGVYSLAKGKYLTPSYRKNGYIQYNLYNKGKMYTFLAHRLIAIKFIPNPNNLPEVNHKDGDKSNNLVSNLEWVSRETNIQHGFGMKLIRPAWLNKFGKDNPKSKPVIQLSHDNNIVNEFESAREAARLSNINYSTISHVLIGKGKTAGGFKWIYKK